MMDTDKWLIKHFGKRGAENLKAHAAAINMPMETFIALADVSPRALLEALVVASHKRRNTPAPRGRDNR